MSSICLVSSNVRQSATKQTDANGAVHKESNNLRFSDLEDIQFSAPKGLFSKPRPYTYQVGSRHSPDTKNTKIYVLGAENCKIHQALKHLRQLISE